MDRAVGLSSSDSQHRSSTRQEIERIAEVLLLLEVPPERASRGIRELFKISTSEAIDVVRKVLTRRGR